MEFKVKGGAMIVSCSDMALFSEEVPMVRTTKKFKNKVEFLAKIKTLPALESFDEKDLKELLSISKIATYEPGELIVKEKSYDGWIYYLIAGSVRIVRKNKDIAVLQRTGDVFGEMGNMGASDLSVSVYAHDVATCLKIDINSVDELPSENRYAFRYAIFRGFAEVLAKRLRITTEKYRTAKQELDKLRRQQN